MIIERNKSIRERVYEKLKEMIFDSELLPGERVVETDFAEKFKVSRTPVREAIRMLELEGLLEDNPNGGVSVKKIGINDIEEVFQIRIALEGIILKEIIEKKSLADIDQLEKLLNETKVIMEENKDTDKIFRLFSKFNDMLYSLSEYPKVVSLIKNINVYLKIFRKYSIDNAVRRQIAYEEHWEIYEALKMKDLVQVLKINEKHLLGSRDFLIRNILKTKSL